MGNFKIVISGIGGHGVQRHKEDGETIDFHADGDWTVDSISKQIATIAKKMFAERSVAAFDAELIHWPGEEGEVRDNLVTGIRTGSFNPKPKEEVLTEEKVIEIVDASLKDLVLGDLTLDEQQKLVDGLTLIPTGDAENSGSGQI